MLKIKKEDMTTVIKCATVSEAQKCAKFINDWQKLIWATWCSDEVTIKVRTQSSSDHAYYEPVDTSGLINIKNPQSSMKCCGVDMTLLYTVSDIPIIWQCFKCKNWERYKGKEEET